jgi:hypothetical protein
MTGMIIRHVISVWRFGRGHQARGAACWVPVDVEPTPPRFSFAWFAYVAVQKAVVGGQFSVQPTALRPLSSVVRPLSSVFRPPRCAGPAARISAGFWDFASTWGRREASSYGRMISSQRHGDRDPAHSAALRAGSSAGAISKSHKGTKPQRKNRIHGERQRNKMSRLYRAETIPSSLQEMASLRAPRLRGGRLSVVRICAKQSQFLQGSGFRAQGTDTRPPTPDAWSVSGAGPIVQNEANFRRPRYPTIPIFHCSSIPGRCRLCETNPISRLRIADCGLGTNLRRDAWPAAHRLRPAQANRAKRTQFLAAEVSHHSNIPLFQHSSPMPIVQNEPNFAGRPEPRRAKCAKRTQFLDCGLWIADWGPTCGGTPARRPAASGLRGPIVQNEPNLRRAEIPYHSYIPLFQHPNPVPVVQNEPNFRRAEIPHHSTILSFHHPHPMPIVRNEPNFRRPRYPTIPIFHCSSIPGRCRLCETNPISPVDQSPGGRNVQNEPNFGAYRAKRSQFPPRPGGGAKQSQFGRAGFRAKQRQFSEVEIRYNSSMLSFECSNPMPGVSSWTMRRAVHYGAGSYFVRTCPPGGRSRVGLPLR